MLGYTYCAMYRGGDITDEVKKEIEQKKQEFKEYVEQLNDNKDKIIDFVTRMPKQ
ncbi:MAG: hypothetical protein K6F66_01810 [Pseudobutyrivibrio sp.]|nr:hypothetical protein [Pseudobutyrivibrio sp.]